MRPGGEEEGGGGGSPGGALAARVSVVREEEGGGASPGDAMAARVSVVRERFDAALTAARPQLLGACGAVIGLHPDQPTEVC